MFTDNEFIYNITSIKTPKSDYTNLHVPQYGWLTTLPVCHCSEHTEADIQDGLKEEENPVLSVDVSIVHANRK